MCRDWEVVADVSRFEPNAAGMSDGLKSARRLQSYATSVRRRRVRARADRTLAALLLAACVIVPVLFSLSEDDVFALPKGVALLTVAVAAVVPVRHHGRDDRGPGAPVAGGSGRDLATGLRRAQHRGRGSRRSSTSCTALQAGALPVSGIPLRYSSTRGSSVSPDGPSARRAGSILLFGAIAMGAVVVAVYAISPWSGLDPIWGYADRVLPRASPVHDRPAQRAGRLPRARHDGLRGALARGRRDCRALAAGSWRWRWA